MRHLGAAAVAAVAALLALSGPARAATNPACPTGSVYWVGGHMAPNDITPNNWDVAANWSNGMEPTATTNVCLDNTDASGSYTVNIDFYNNIDANSITIGGDPGNTVTLALLGSGGGAQTGDELHLTNQSAGGGVLSNGAITLGSSPAASPGITGGQPGLIDVMSGTLVNRGAITSEPYNGQNANTISGGLDNEGTLNVTDSLNLNGPDVNGAGIINIAAANTLNVNFEQTDSTFTQTGGAINDQGTFTELDGTFTASGGTSTGNPLLLSSDNAGVDVDLAGTATDTVHAQTGGANLTGDVGAGDTLWSSGVPGDTQGSLFVAGTYTNHGTIELGAGGTDQTQSTLNIKSGALTNAGSIISENTNGGGGNSIDGTLVNTGTLSLQESIGGTGQITNQGGVSLAGGMTISATSFAQTTPGTLSIAIVAGSSALQNPVLALTGAAGLGGGLAVATTGSQSSAVTLVKAASVSGTFPSPQFSGQSYGVVYTPTTVSLSPAAGTPTPPTPVKPRTGAEPKVGAISGHAGALTIRLSCPSGGGSCATATIKLTVTKKVKRAKGKRASRVVTVGSGTARLTAGNRRSVSVKLNRAGLALLKGRRTLKVRVTVTAGGRVVRRVTATVHAATVHRRHRRK